MLDIKKIRKDFPILNIKINAKPLIYLDNAATTQKPKSVINAITEYYEKNNANIHRGIHTLSEKATEQFENTRLEIKNFINAKSTKEIIFTKNLTEAINLIAYSWGNQNIKKGDEIIVTLFEHHSNLVPWQELAKRKKAILKTVNITKDLTLDLEDLKSKLSKKTKLVSLTSISNVTGTINDLKNIIPIIKSNSNAKILVDGAQSTGHIKTDVQKLDCDFYTIAAHKMLGPTGIGVLYGKEEILEKMPPFLFGGEMIKTVTKTKSTFTDLPHKFEAGTPNIADIIAFSKAIKYIEDLGFENIKSHEQTLIKEAKTILQKFPEIKIFAPTNLKDTSSVLSFTIKGIHPHDIATIFDSEGIEIRSGQHCNEPLMTHLKVPATARISFYIYNSIEELKTLEKAIIKTIKIFK